MTRTSMRKPLFSSVLMSAIVV